MANKRARHTDPFPPSLDAQVHAVQLRARRVAMSLYLSALIQNGHVSQLFESLKRTPSDRSR